MAAIIEIKRWKIKREPNAESCNFRMELRKPSSQKAARPVRLVCFSERRIKELRGDKSQVTYLE